MQLRDFSCPTCDVIFEALVASSSVTVTPCPTCSADSERVMSAPRIGIFNDVSKKSEALKKRSQEHTIRELKKEPEKHGFKAADKRPWNIRRKPS